MTEIRVLLPDNQRRCLVTVLVTAPRVGRSYEQFGNGFFLHLPTEGL